MARELGIHHSTYSLVKHRKYLPGRKVLEAIVKRFPDLKGEVSLFLTSDMQINQEGGTINQITPQHSPSRKLRGLGIQALRHYLGGRILKRG